MLGTQLLLCAAHAAAPATVGPVVITVPEGFAPAQTQKLRKTLITAWTKSARGGAGSLKTLLQINVIDFGSPPGKPTAPADLERYAEKYLRQSLDAIQLRRTDYTSSPSAHITLAGLPAVRATWNGALAGRATVGVMYSVIVKSRYAVIFHTQDLGSTPSSGMFEAMQAIEAVTLSEPSAPSAAAAASSGMS